MTHVGVSVLIDRLAISSNCLESSFTISIITNIIIIIILE